jgi:hypothetical protein
VLSFGDIPAKASGAIADSPDTPRPFLKRWGRVPQKMKKQSIAQRTRVHRWGHGNHHICKETGRYLPSLNPANPAGIKFDSVPLRRVERWSTF